MNSHSIHEEIEEELRGKRHPVRKFIIILTATLFLGGGVMALADRHSDSTPDTSADSLPVATPASTPAPAPVPAPAPTPPAAIPKSVSTSQANDVAAGKAMACSGLIKAANDLNNGHNSQYMDAWKSWLDTYRGSYDTQTPIDSKNWYKDHFHQLFNDIISTTNANYQNACNTTGSLADILIQPNYDAW